MSDGLSERGHALEGAFFMEKDRELLQRFREELAAEELRHALSNASGITDEELLNHLIENNISPTSFTSFSLLPLIQVAWADGKMQKAEREAILNAAEQSGIAKGSAALEVLESWLDEAPSDELYATWKEYAGSLKETLDPAQVTNLKNRILGRAREVAEAAGGFLGFGNKVSDEEAAVLEELAAAF